jgi:hypothetical protein
LMRRERDEEMGPLALTNRSAPASTFSPSPAQCSTDRPSPVDRREGLLRRRKQHISISTSAEPSSAAVDSHAEGNDFACPDLPRAPPLCYLCTYLSRPSDSEDAIRNRDPRDEIVAVQPLIRDRDQLLSANFASEGKTLTFNPVDYPEFRCLPRMRKL